MHDNEELKEPTDWSTFYPKPSTANREAVAEIRGELQHFANWWADYITDEHYTGNSYCLEAMQEKTDECVFTILSLIEPKVLSDEEIIKQICCNCPDREREDCECEECQQFIRRVSQSTIDKGE